MMTGKKHLIALFAVVFVFAHMGIAAAQVETKAREAIIVDANTGVVLLDKEADAQMPTSSMSKVMTIYMLFEDLKAGRVKLDDTFLVSEKAWRMGGSKMFIKVGDRVKVEDLIRGIIIQSGNDATIAVAEGLAGSEEAFAQAMTARAKDLGMTKSHFVNASGWPDPEHYSTPRDLALLAYRIIHDFPEYYHYFAEKEFTYNKIRQPNRLPILGIVKGADGLKTGHAEEAGYGLIAAAERDGRRVIVVANGMASEAERKEEGIKLIEWAFRSFETKKLLVKGDELQKAKVWLGKQEEVPLVAAEDLTVLLPRAKAKDVKMTLTFEGPLKAPVKQGEEVGLLKVEVPDQSPVEVKVVTGAAVSRLGAWGRAKKRATYIITHQAE